MRINRELSDRLARRMYVDPGDEEFGQCFFNARRALLRLNRLSLAEGAVYTEGYAVYLNYHHNLHGVAGHGWITHHNGIIDVDYADYGRYDATYFPGLHLTGEEVYQRLQSSTPPGTRSAFGLAPMGVEMARAYVQACEYLQAVWPHETTPYDLEHLEQWRETLAVLTREGQ